MPTEQGPQEAILKELSRHEPRNQAISMELMEIAGQFAQAYHAVTGWIDKSTKIVIGLGFLPTNSCKHNLESDPTLDSMFP